MRMDEARSRAQEFVGRRQELDHALHALQAGVGVVVIGRRGSGRTRFMRELTERVDGAIHPALWVGEDLPQLSADQAVRWAEAVRARQIIPVASMLEGSRLPEPIAHLQRDEALTTIELGPLSARELLAVAEARLAGRLDPACVPTFIPSAGGGHLAALAEAIGAAQAAGALTRIGDTWRLMSPVPRSESLRVLILSHLGVDPDSSSDETETILDVLALASDLSLAAMDELLSRLGVLSGVEEMLERLEASGVIEAGSGTSGPTLRLRDAIDELAIPLTLGVLRRRRLSTALVETLSARSPTDLTTGELVAYARYGLEDGVRVPGPILTRAARASLRTANAPLSLHFAAAALAAGEGFAAEMAMASAEAQNGAADRALTRLARITAEAADDLQRTEAVAAMVRHVRRYAVEALEIIDGESIGLLALPDARRSALKGLMLYSLGDPTAALELIEPALPGLSGLELAEALFHVGAVHLIMGRTTRAEVALDEAEEAYLAVGADTSDLQMARSTVDVLRGRMDRSLTAVREFRDQAEAFGQPVAQGVCGWTLGNLLVSAGSVRDAIDEFRSAIRIMEEAGLTGTLALVRMDLALALALAGHEAEAIDALPWAGPDDHGLGFGATGKYLQVEGWIHAAAGRRSEARASFVRASHALSAGRFPLPALAALIDAARINGASPLLPHIEELGRDMDGECVEVALRFARALAARDSLDTADVVGALALAREFDEIGAASREIGQLIVSAEALDHAAGLHLLGHDDRSAAASRRLRDLRITAAGLERLPLVPLTSSSPLSERELEVAALAARGLSNREIAESLVLSVRTVETHLQRVYHKLGVRRRNELARVLTTEDDA